MHMYVHPPSPAPAVSAVIGSSYCLRVCQQASRSTPKMGKHLSADELDNIQKWKTAGVTTSVIQGRLLKARQRKSKRRGATGPDITTVRRAVRGTSFKRARVETRGAKKILSTANLHALDRVRLRLIKKADNDSEVHWEDVMRAARVPKCDPTTVAKNMKVAGLDVCARRPRMKPSRHEIDEIERKRICNKWRKYPASFWKNIHLIMDNKKWPVPRTARGKKYLKALKVRFHLRKKSEGLQKGFTKPHPRKHRTNTGGNVNVFAGIINCKVKLWHYLPASWTGQAAEDLYRDVISPALKQHHGKKRRYTTLEDNDPTGYKSWKAVNTKQELNICPLEFPKYSPDLNPCDYSLWAEVEARMATQKPPANESLVAFKARLRRTALSIPKAVIAKMLASMKERSQQVYDNNGGHIPRD
jgi:transposase